MNCKVMKYKPNNVSEIVRKHIVHGVWYKCIYGLEYENNQNGSTAVMKYTQPVRNQTYDEIFDKISENRN